MPDLVQQIVITAPIETVWAEITRLGAVQRAMMDTVLRTVLQPGAPLRYVTRDGSRTFIVGRVVEVDPPRRFAHTYRMTTRSDPDTLVTWELAEVDGGTRVTVRHTGWPDPTKGLQRVDRTWAGILAELKRVVETGDIGARTKVTYALMRAFLWAMPPRTRTANVDDAPAMGAPPNAT